MIDLRRSIRDGGHRGNWTVVIVEHCKRATSCFLSLRNSGREYDGDIYVMLLSYCEIEPTIRASSLQIVKRILISLILYSCITVKITRSFKNLCNRKF